jgi:hypothetical protein
MASITKKLDSDDMMVQNKADHDVTNMSVYNAGDSDVHPLVLRMMDTCDRFFAVADALRSTMRMSLRAAPES